MPVINQYTKQSRGTGFIQKQNTQGVFGNGIGQAIQGMGEQLEQFAVKKAKSDYVTKLSALKLDNLRAQEKLKTQDFGDVSVGDGYLQDLEARASQIKVNPLVRDQWEADLANMKSEFLNAGLQEGMQREGTRAKLEWETSLKNWSDIVSVDPSKVEDGAQNLSEIIDSNPTLDPDEKEYAKSKIQGELEKTALYSELERDPVALKNKLSNFTSDGNFDFDDSMRLVEKNEGGFVAVDGSSGSPAIYGINRKWHKEAFDKAKKITEENGEAAGKQFAKDYYKKTYWDEYDIGSLTGGQRAVVLDGVINHRVSFAKELADAAKNGASPEKLIAMRKSEYNRLAQNDKYKPDLNGWMNRLDNVSGYVARSNLPNDELIKLTEQVDKKILFMQDKAQKDAKIRTILSDVGTWDKFINNEMSLLDIQKQPDGKMKELMLSSYYDNIPKKLDIEQAEKYVDLIDKQAVLNAKIGGDDANPKITQELLSEYKAFNDEVAEASAAGYLTASQTNDFLKKFNAPIMNGIVKNNTKGEGMFWNKGIQSPFKAAFKKIDNALINSGLENNPVIKKSIVLKFSDYLSDYESSGDDEKDELVIKKALTRAIIKTNEESGFSVSLDKKPANLVVQKTRQVEMTDKQGNKALVEVDVATNKTIRVIKELN